MQSAASYGSHPSSDIKELLIKGGSCKMSMSGGLRPDSRASNESEIWTTSSIGTGCSPITPSEVFDVPTPQGFRGHSFESDSMGSSSEYSPSLASIREAVIRSPALNDARPLHTSVTKMKPEAHMQGLAIQLSPDLHSQPVRAVHSNFARAVPPRRHSSIDSTSSGRSSDSDVPIPGYGHLLPGPAKNQRMQSFLAPKMKLISPAPWDADPLGDATTSAQNSWSGSRGDESKSTKSRRTNSSFSKATSLSMSGRSKASFESSRTIEHSPQKPTILMRRKTETEIGPSPMSINTFPRPPNMPTLLHGAMQLQQKTPDDKKTDPLNTPHPLSAGSTVSTLPRSSSLNSDTGITTSTSNTSLFSSSTLGDKSLSPTTTAPSRTSAESPNEVVPPSTFKLISLDAARERERVNPFPNNISTDSRRKDSAETNNSSTSSVPTKQLKSKKSGFLKMFNRKEEPLPLPPPPTTSLQLPTHPLPTTVVRSAPPQISTFAEAEAAAKSGPPLASPSLRPSAQVSFLAPPTPNPQDRIGRHQPNIDKPSLALRPVSMAFSNNFAQELMVRLPDTDEAHVEVLTPLSSTSRTESQQNTPATPFFPSDTTQEKLASAQQSWKTQMWELEQQVRKLESEVDSLRLQRDTLVSSRAGKDACSACGCHCGGATLATTSVVSRPRPRPEGGSERALFGSGN